MRIHENASRRGDILSARCTRDGVSSLHPSSTLRPGQQTNTRCPFPPQTLLLAACRARWGDQSSANVRLPTTVMKPGFGWSTEVTVSDSSSLSSTSPPARLTSIRVKIFRHSDSVATGSTVSASPRPIGDDHGVTIRLDRSFTFGVQVVSTAGSDCAHENHRQCRPSPAPAHYGPTM